MRKSFALAALLGVASALTPVVFAQASDAEGSSEPAAEEGTTTAPSAESDGQEKARAERDFKRRIGTQEETVNRLKEEVFKSKATLQLLKEIVILGGSAGARSTVVHVNRLGPSYRLESVAYYLDGQSIFAKADPTGSLDAAKELKIWDAAIPPGDHTLQVNMVLRGNGFGVFEYVDDYTFKVTSSYAFTAAEGDTTQIRAVVNERRGIGIDFKDRLTVDFEADTVSTGESSSSDE